MGFTIKKIKVYPDDKINWEQGVYLGLSINNRMFRDQNALEEIVHFISQHKKECHLLIGDYLHRYNEVIFNGLSLNEATEIIRNKTKDTVELVMTEAGKHGITIIPIYTEEVVMSAGFPQRLQRVKDVFEENSRFNELVEYTIDVFLRRQDEIKISLSEARKYCLEYLLEELAIFEVLAERGFLVNIYPGNQLPITKELVCGHLKNVSAPLEKIQAVEIKFRPKNK